MSALAEQPIQCTQVSDSSPRFVPKLSACLEFDTHLLLCAAAMPTCMGVRGDGLFALAAPVWWCRRAWDARGDQPTHFFNGHSAAYGLTRRTLRVLCMSEERPLHASYTHCFMCFSMGTTGLQSGFARSGAGDVRATSAYSTLSRTVPYAPRAMRSCEQS